MLLMGSDSPTATLWTIRRIWSNMSRRKPRHRFEHVRHFQQLPSPVFFWVDRERVDRLLGARVPHEVGGPLVHQAAPTLEEITAGVGRLGGVLYRMGECGLDHFAGCVRPFRGPVPEARPEPMRHGGDAEFLGQSR